VIEKNIKVILTSQNLFEDEAVTAIHGIVRNLQKSNPPAGGALIAAAKQKSKMVYAAHVRLASTELF
jgi:hypothetical protein